MTKITPAKVLTFCGMVTSTIVFIFTTFETKSEAEDKQKSEAQVVQIINQKIDSLHDDFKESHKEVMDRFDRLDQGQRLRR